MFELGRINLYIGEGRGGNSHLPLNLISKSSGYQFALHSFNFKSDLTG